MPVFFLFQPNDCLSRIRYLYIHTYVPKMKVDDKTAIPNNQNITLNLKKSYQLLYFIYCIIQVQTGHFLYRNSFLGFESEYSFKSES